VNRENAERLLRAELDRHGFQEWRINWTRSKRTFGYCNAPARTIGLSGPLVDLNSEAEVLDTTRHEVAHALAPGDGHGWRWRGACARTGARPERCFSALKVVCPPSAWLGTCPAGHVSHKIRLPRRPLSCNICSRRFNPAHLFTWSRTIAVAPTPDSALNVEIKAVLKLYLEGDTFCGIDRAMGWPDAHGARSYAIIKRAIDQKIIGRRP